jgi:predicted Rdx family selenoprotein
VAALIEDQLGVAVTITPGAKGEFTVWVDGEKVAAKDPEVGFPEDEACVRAVQERMS